MKKNIFFHEKNLKKTVESAVFELTDSSGQDCFLSAVHPFPQNG